MQGMQGMQPMGMSMPTQPTQPAMAQPAPKANAQTLPQTATMGSTSSLKANIVQIAGCLDAQQGQDLDVSGLRESPAKCPRCFVDRTCLLTRACTHVCVERESGACCYVALSFSCSKVAPLVDQCRYDDGSLDLFRLTCGMQPLPRGLPRLVVLVPMPSRSPCTASLPISR